MRARIYARGEVSFAKFLFLPSWFAKLLEANFSYFAKIIWMPSWFAKLLELLLKSIKPGFNTHEIECKKDTITRSICTTQRS
jgi:hypothetical protein